MAISVRRIVDSAMFAQAIAHNKLLAAASIVGASFHADVTSLTAGDFMFPVATSLQVTVLNAVDLPSCIALAVQEIGVMQAMMKDGISTDPYSGGAHKIPDVVNSAAIAVPVDLPSVIVAANALKAQINAHFTQAGVHFTNDGTNTIATANATILSDSIALLIAIKVALNAHISAAPAGSVMVKLTAT